MLVLFTPELAATFVKVAVLRYAVLWLVTGRPIYTLVAMPNFCMAPTCDQLVPSPDTYPAKRLPLRISRTQAGARLLLLPRMLVSPPAFVRHWKLTPRSEEHTSELQSRQ